MARARPIDFDAQNIATFKGDLSSFTVPAFILSTTSLAEYPAYWTEQPSRFVAPAREDNAQKRALLVLTWFLTTLKQQYDHRKDRKKGKPLNPVLGELFLGDFESDVYGTTNVVAEQVCHHPPVTAYRIRNNDNGITLTGYHAAKTFFANRAVHMHKIGQVKLHLDKYDEDYLITFPQLHLEGFIPPPPYPEIDAEPVFIKSTSGYTAKITFSGKGWLRGKRNSFFASVYPDGKETEQLYTAQGQWSGTFTIKDARSGTTIEEYDSNASVEKLILISVAPLEEQDPMESRRLWNKFATKMNQGDMSGVSAEKNRIEVRQRQMRKDEEKEGKTWERRYFSNTPVDEKVEALCADIGLKVDPALTGGFWQFDEEKFRNATRRTHGPFDE